MGAYLSSKPKEDHLQSYSQAKGDARGKSRPVEAEDPDSDPDSEDPGPGEDEVDFDNNRQASDDENDSTMGFKIDAKPATPQRHRGSSLKLADRFESKIGSIDAQRRRSRVSLPVDSTFKSFTRSLFVSMGHPAVIWDLGSVRPLRTAYGSRTAQSRAGGRTLRMAIIRDPVTKD